MSPDVRRRLQIDVHLATLEAALVRAEAAAGHTPPGTTRPTYPHERHVDFAGIDRFQQAAYHDTAAALRGLRTTIMAGMTEALAGKENPVQLMRAIRSFGLEQPPAVRDAIMDTTRRIAESLGTVQHSAAQSLLNEAGRQSALVAGRTAVAVDAAGYTDQAAAGTTVMWQRLNGAASAAATPRATSDDILGAAESTSIASAVDNTRQQIHEATGAGRMDAIGQLPEPKRVYASELLDRATCAACEPIDGHEYENLDAGLIDYPGAAGYIDCLGGGRCRGTLVLVWDEDDSYPTDGTPAPQPPVTDPNRPDRIDQPPLPEAQPTPAGIDPTEPYAVEPGTMSADTAEQALTRVFEHPNFGTDPHLETWAGQLEARLDAIDAAENAAKVEAIRLQDARAAEAARSKRRRAAAAQKVIEEQGRLITQEGMAEMDALAEAAGITRESAGRRVIMERARASGFKGNYNEWLEKTYRDYLEVETVNAENATRGHMLSPAGRARADKLIREGSNPDPIENLWRKNEAYTRHNASEELRNYWDENGRTSFVEWRERMMTDDWRNTGGNSASGMGWNR